MCGRVGKNGEGKDEEGKGGWERGRVEGEKREDGGEGKGEWSGKGGTEGERGGERRRKVLVSKIKLFFPFER